jgi:hypothetical protein
MTMTDASKANEQYTQSVGYTTLMLLAWESWNCCRNQSTNGSDSSVVFMLKLGEDKVRSELSGLVYFATCMQAKTETSVRRIKGSASRGKLR